ncbi:MAG: hypothetical protein WBE18_04920, partial [Gammaproteobacteria bacterium]
TKLHPAVGEYIPVFYGLPTTPTRHSYPTTLIYKKYATTPDKPRHVGSKERAARRRQRHVLNAFALCAAPANLAEKT